MMMDPARARRGTVSVSRVMALVAILAILGGGSDVDALDRDAAAIPADDITITEVFNNILYREEMTASWGFSCVIRLPGRTILFDTGGRETSCSITWRPRGSRWHR